MDDSKPAVLASRSKRRFRGAEEKRQIIEEALRPGASVAAVARAHGVNANMLFHWRKLYRAGLLLNAEGGGVRLLPVRVSEEIEAGKRAVVKREAGVWGTIEVSFAKSQVRITGKADAEAVRAVLECLSR
jgi:transposase